MILKVKIQSWENVYFFADNPAQQYVANLERAIFTGSR